MLHKTMNNAVFIIGAGSSKEYGYPIWKELKVEIDTFLNLPGHKGKPLFDKAKEWLEEVTEKKTLDQVISEKNSEIRAKLDPSKVEAVIWQAIAFNFFELEKNVLSVKKTGWIDAYVEKINQILIKKYDRKDLDWDNKIIDELHDQLDNVWFITFNYDRILEYKIRENIFSYLKADINNDGRFEAKLEPKIISVLTNKIYHPHGIINVYEGLDDNSKIDKKRNSGNVSSFGKAEAALLQFSPSLMASCFDCDMNSGTFLDIEKKNMMPEEIYILGNSTYGLNNNLKKLPCRHWAGSVKRIVCTSFEKNDEGIYDKIIKDTFEKEIPIVYYKTCTEFIEKESA